MFSVTKRMEISASHSLDLPYESACKNLHGHNWIIKVTCQCKLLDECGMVVDFQIIKNVVNILDHKNLNELGHVLGGVNPTAENIALSIYELLEDHEREQEWGRRGCIIKKISVQESEGNTACYTP